MRGSVIFVSPSELVFSDIVEGEWNRPLVDLVVESQAIFGGGFATNCCEYFVNWCRSQPDSVGTWTVLSGFQRSEDDPWQAYDDAMAELAIKEPKPILVDLDEYTISQSDLILWPEDENGRRKRSDPRTRPEDSPFLAGWYGQDFEGYREGDGTYDCYTLDSLPPIQTALDRTFKWLSEAKNHYESKSRDNTLRALEHLISSSGVLLPSEFVDFFRSADYWRKVRSCTDCYFHLDSEAVPIRGGLGSLVRFLSDSQDCIHWNLFIPEAGGRPSVVATYRFSGSESASYPGGQPHPKDITTCAASFEEFIYRFWLENEIWFALHDMGDMPPGGREYLAHYKPDKFDE